ncbi:hypothetical protein PFICI_01870 [Pestalotiopsis fici W106-1]|uniref:F-box domain-containing protein n=1 Tax=Pestalotiopsis fici (strain W106-1 / CGMCC3.15140) TaxID=1229662 RepID=W3XR97_PESFW|nr:uncharacterized protein PFICI_01870 [Pestalotiopsis fici W106-1]ETS88042.1 hypothetical protein PFICI_01870 [Pestalotiopsis fici W106-1]
MSETHSKTCMKETNKPAGNLTSLPAELRLLIYGHLFRRTKHVVVASGGYADKAREYDDKNKSNRTWPILLTCRGLHDEAWTSYWSHARVKAYVTWRQLPEALPPSTPLSRVRHLSLRIHTLSARWDQILPDLEQTVPNLQTLVIRDEDLYLEPEHWLELFGGSSSSSSCSSSCAFPAETIKARQERAQKIYHEIIAPKMTTTTPTTPEAMSKQEETGPPSPSCGRETCSETQRRGLVIV